MLPSFRVRHGQWSLRAFLLMCIATGAAVAMIANYVMTVGHTLTSVQTLERLGVDVQSDFHERYGLNPPQRKGKWSSLLEWSLATPVHASVFSARAIDTATIVELIASLPTLERLNLMATELTLGHLEQLAKLPRLEELSLVATSVNDSGIGILAKLPRLRWLDLSETNVSDAGLRQIDGLTSLESVILNKTRVSRHGLLTLHRSRTDLTVRPRPSHRRHRRPAASRTTPLAS